METHRKTLKVAGMSCGNCSSSVEKALLNVDGVTEAEVSHETGEAVVTFDAAKVDVGTLSTTIKAAGFEVVA